jgi:hypothetical protein
MIMDEILITYEQAADTIPTVVYIKQLILSTKTINHLRIYK